MQQQDYSVQYPSTDIERIDFYKKTYGHLAGSLLIFLILEALLLKLVPESVIMAMVGTKFVWLFVIGGFWLVSMLATNFAHAEDRNKQYLGLGLYIVIEAIIFMPLLYIIVELSPGGINTFNQALIVTLALFAGLSAIVFVTKKDFSFLRSALIVAGFVSLGLIVAGAIFGFDLGLWFSAAMCLVAGGSILYQTSNLLHNYRTDQYVGAALGLFSSFMLLFWYILRIFSRR
ncbi:MAG: Bax inhibitor-1/YccA family protein [Chitinophagaceae bacterium]|nr:Bax inhibitor-1/YccA family protein [Chitinophagaceae bacterium]